MSRTVRRVPDADEFIVTDDGLEKRYSFKPIPTVCDGVDDPAFEVTSECGDVYHVHCGEWGASCDCADFVYRRANSKVPCRHVLALAALKIITLPHYQE